MGARAWWQENRAFVAASIDGYEWRRAVETELECETLRAGGMLPLILGRFLPKSGTHAEGEQPAPYRRLA